MRTNSDSPTPASPEIDQAAFHGLLGEITEAIRPNTEAAPIGIIAHLMAFFGNSAGRSARYEVEGVWHTTNLYFALVGITSHARKGTAAARARQPFALADPDWAHNRLMSGMSTGEGLIWAIRDPTVQDVLDKKTEQTQRVTTDHGVADKRLMILKPEFGRFLQVAPRQNNTLSPVLRQAWESGRLHTLTKNSTAHASNALISVVAHVTKTSCSVISTTSASPTASPMRFIFLTVHRTCLLPFGGADINFTSLAAHLATALDFARKAQRITMDADARDLWAHIYPDLNQDVPASPAPSAPAPLHKSSDWPSIFALADRSFEIQRPHLTAAKAIWDCSEASIGQIFGDAFGDPIADTILAALRARKSDGLSRTEIEQAVQRQYPRPQNHRRPRNPPPQQQDPRRHGRSPRRPPHRNLVRNNMKPVPEPAQDAPHWHWSRYFDDQIRIINQDLAAENSSLDKELASFRGPQPRLSAESRRLKAWCRQYLAELHPRSRP